MIKKYNELAIFQFLILDFFAEREFCPSPYVYSVVFTPIVTFIIGQKTNRCDLYIIIIGCRFKYASG